MTCTDEQIRKLLKYAISYPQEIAAAKAGMSFSTAKRYLKMRGKRKSVKKTPRVWRTREDPFVDVWPEVRALLESDSGLEAKTLMEWLLAKYPDKFHPGQERTLRRRVHDWRVLEGPERREVMFPQNILPGRQSQSDYTHCSELEVTICGIAFRHLLFHFMLPYSRWEFVWICFTESFETLTTGYGRAVRALGYVAPEHRTDNLAAAVPIGERNAFQARWIDFLKHFGAEPSANNPGCSNENGSVEKSHHLFKHAIDQRLRLRGSREFKSIEEYDRYLQNAVTERNRHRHERLQEELQFLTTMPATDWYDPRQYAATVNAWSTIGVGGALYSVPSRYIGQKLRVLADYESVRVYYGRHLIISAPRKESGGRCIDYRHVIFHLLRKPGAFQNYQFREELFPRLVFRQAYDALLVHNDERADKEYLLILNQAALGSEDAVCTALAKLLENNSLPTSEAVRQLCELPKSVPYVEVDEPKLDGYDNLLSLDFRKELNK
jgi:transposase